MDKATMAVISLLILSFLLVIALRAWRKRIAIQSASFDEPLEALDFFGQLLFQSTAFYVATTHANNHLERIAAYGLGPRGNAQIMVFAEGVLIIRTGERPLAIALPQIIGVTLNQAVIDKAVEAGGLVSIEWQQNSAVLATHLRVVDSNNRKKLIEQIAQISTTRKK